MIKVKEDCFYNQNIIQFDEAKEELLIFDKLIANEQLITYLEKIIINKSNGHITINLLNPSNNLRLILDCSSYFYFNRLALFNTKTCEVVVEINEEGLSRLGVEAHEALFYFSKEIFLGDKNVSK